MRPRHACGAIALLALALTAQSASAAPAGAPDPSFDGDGRRVLAVDGYPEEVLVQPDGKIVVAGSDTAKNFAVWRLNANGSPDASFDGDGMAVVDLGGEESGRAAALQADGKIVIAGGTFLAKSYLAVARLNTNGSLDKSFGAEGEGRKLVPADNYATAVAIQRDGRILLTSQVDGNFWVTRLSTGGEPDGTVYEPADFGGLDEPRAATLQADGRLVVAGSSAEQMLAGSQPGAVARYNADGKLDKTFSEDGKVAYGPAAPNAVLAQANGGIVVAGESVARLTATGAPDAAFSAPVAFDVAGAALQRDGKIDVAGTAGGEVAAARLLPGGGFDRSFGALGATTIGFGDENLAYSAAVQGDGRFVVAGRAAIGGSARLVVGRLLADPPPVVARPSADTRPPRLTRLRVVKRRLAIRFRLSEPARVRLRLARGHKVRVIAVRRAGRREPRAGAPRGARPLPPRRHSPRPRRQRRPLPPHDLPPLPSPLPKELLMTQVLDRIRNGVDSAQMYGTLDAIKADHSLGVFQFRVRNHWIDGAHNRSTIQGFYGAGQEDASREQAFTLDAGEPAVLLGSRHRRQSRRASAPRARGVPDHVAGLRRHRAQGAPDRGRVDGRGRHGRPRRARHLRRGPQRLHADPRELQRQGRRARREAARARRAREGPLRRVRHRDQRRPGRGRGRHRLTCSSSPQRPSRALAWCASPRPSPSSWGSVPPCTTARRRSPTRASTRSSARATSRRRSRPSTAGSASRRCTTSSSPRAAWLGATRRSPSA